MICADDDPLAALRCVRVPIVAPPRLMSETPGVRKLVIVALVAIPLCACRPTAPSRTAKVTEASSGDASSGHVQSNPAPGRGSQQPRREIHIQIRYEGDGIPPSSELDKRDALEDALRAENVGEVVDAGGGMGVMDIYLAVDDVAIAMADAKAIVKRLGLEDRTTVEPVPASPDQLQR